MVAVVVVAGVVGAALDQLHVRTGTLSYDTPSVAGQAWWVGVQFGALLTLATWATALITVRPLPVEHVRMGPEPGIAWSRPPRARITIDATWFVIAYGISAVPAAVDHGGLVRTLALATLGVLAAIRLRLRGDRRVALVALGLAVGGSTYEAVASTAWTFQYGSSDIFGVPIWLPVLYATGAPLASSVAMLLDARGHKARQRTNGMRRQSA